MSQAQPVHIFAHIAAKAGHEQEVREALIGLTAQANAEPGCRGYILHEDVQTPGNFHVFEIYDDQAAFEAHLASPHAQAAFAKLGPLAEGTPSIVTTHPIAGHQT